MRMKLYCTKFGKLVEAHPFSGGELIQLANLIDDLKCDVKTSAVFDRGLPTLILTKGDDVVTLKPHQCLLFSIYSDCTLTTSLYAILWLNLLLT